MLSARQIEIYQTGDIVDVKPALNKIAARKDLTGVEMRGVMRAIMAGNATSGQIGAFLMGLRTKGETVGEIAAAVSIMREMMVPVEAPENAIDIVGTGGDGLGTLNISTASAIVVAAQAYQLPSMETARCRLSPAPLKCSKC